ncbi:Golgin candidate [Arachis hypogaea]|nr:Golgin candidate [Arachis hypogaea]
MLHAWYLSYNYVKQLLDPISNGKLAYDRRNAIIELQAIVSENQASQLAFDTTGFPVTLSVLKEEREDVEMVTNFSSLSCLLSN